MKRFLSIWISVLALFAVIPFHLNAADDAAAKSKEKTETTTDVEAEPAEDAAVPGDAGAAQENPEADADADSAPDPESPDPAMAETSVSLPLEIQCGTLTSAVLSESGVQWVVVDSALMAKTFEAPSMIIGEATEVRTPAEDKTFALITVEIASGRSIGRQDYVLKSYGETFECLAIKGSGDTYDFRRWQIETSGVPQTATLLFEVRSDTTDGELTYTLNTTVPQPPVPLSFAEESEPTASGTPVEAGELPADTAVGSAPAETTAPDDSKAAVAAVAKPPAEKPEKAPAKAAPTAKASDDDWN